MNSNRCRECMGTGGIERLETCSYCKGTGEDPLYVKPSASDPVKKYRFKGAAGEYVYSVDFDKAQKEIERLKKIVNFQDAVACVFDNLKMVAANTRCKEWDDQLEEFAEEVIEFAPEYKKQWKDLVVLERKNWELTQAFAKAIDLLYETGMAHSRIDQILIK